MHKKNSKQIQNKVIDENLSIFKCRKNVHFCKENCDGNVVVGGEELGRRQGGLNYLVMIFSHTS